MEEKNQISFSQTVKKEILSAEILSPCCVHAAAYGMACFARVFDETGLILHTETTAVAQLAKKLFSALGLNGKIYVRGTADSRIYEFAVKDAEDIARMLEQFGHVQKLPSLRINSKNFVCEHCVGSFTAGAFLACGTMTNPQKEYNLEFVSGRYHLIQDFSALLKGRGFSPKYTQRKGNHVLYFKASEQIEDMLTYMGASGAALEIMNLKVFKDIRNKANRITNCETANIDKTVQASGATLAAIEYLKSNHALEGLPQALQEAAKLREEFPDVSLKELAEKFTPPLSKSGISHRMKKLEQAARNLKERKNNG